MTNNGRGASQDALQYDTVITITILQGWKQHPTETQNQYKLQNQSPFVGNNTSFAWYCFNFHENWPTNIYNESYLFLPHPSHTHHFKGRWNQALEPKRATLECLSFISCEHRYLQRGEPWYSRQSNIRQVYIYINTHHNTFCIFVYIYIQICIQFHEMCIHKNEYIYNIDV